MTRNRPWLTALLAEARAEAARRPERPPVALVLPEATALKLLSHPWASRLLPQMNGIWFRNPNTGETEFRAMLTADDYDRFLEGVKRLAPEQ
jgi:hypothetical protein